MKIRSDYVAQSPNITPALKMDMQRRLRAWFAREKRDLPWRGLHDPYAIWISEVMLQQTQVRTVRAYYDRFMRAFPDIIHLARTDLQAVLKQWEGLGYYSRARNAHRTAQIIVEQMDARIPANREILRSLPGIGDYIASAVMSIAFGGPFAVVDGNVKRVLARLFGLDVPVNQPGAKKIFQQTADMLLDHLHPGDHNQAVMELGALICTPRSPLCPRCPLKTHCRAHNDAAVDRYPQRVARARIPRQHLVVCVIRKQNRILIVKRPAEGLLGGMWEFPGGLIQADEQPQAACARLMAQTVHLKIHNIEPVTTVRHTYSHFRIVMNVFMCDWLQGRVQPDGPVDFQWIDPNHIGEFPIHRAVLKAWPEIRDNL